MEQEAVKLELGDPEITSMSLMKQLANDDTNTVIDINGEQLIDRTKLFLVVQARNSLKRIIKLTNFMEKLENKFIDTVTEQIDEGPANLSMISLAMETVSKCLADANMTVTQVLKDDKLQKIVINTTNIITPDGGSATVIDPASRDEVRNLAASLLAQLSKFDTSEVIEVEVSDKKESD